MNSLQLIFVLVAVGVVMWLVNAYIPMQENIKRILNIPVVIIVILWLITVVFHLGSLGSIHP